MNQSCNIFFPPHVLHPIPKPNVYVHLATPRLKLKMEFSIKNVYLRLLLFHFSLLLHSTPLDNQCSGSLLVVILSWSFSVAVHLFVHSVCFLSWLVIGISVFRNRTVEALKKLSSMMNFSGHPVRSTRSKGSNSSPP